MTFNTPGLVGLPIILLALIACYCCQANRCDWLLKVSSISLSFQFFIQQKFPRFILNLASPIFNSQYLMKYPLVRVDDFCKNQDLLSNFRGLSSGIREFLKNQEIPKINYGLKGLYKVAQNNHSLQQKSIPFLITNDIKILVKGSKYQSWQNGNRCWYGRFYTRISLA